METRCPLCAKASSRTLCSCERSHSGSQVVLSRPIGKCCGVCLAQIGAALVYKKQQ